MRNRVFRGSRGVSIVEAVIAAFVIGLVGTAIMTYFTSSTRVARAAHMMAVRDQIYTSIYQNITPSALWKSMYQGSMANNALRNCVDSSLGSCVITSAASQAGFYLLAETPSGASSIIAGKGTIPAKYNEDGMLRLTAADGKETFYAYASFWASCYPNSGGAIPATCQAAETIWVRVIVRVAGGVSDAALGGLDLESQPPSGLFAGSKHLFAIPIAVKDIALIGGTQCSPSARFPGSRVRGYDIFGKPICQCMSACSCRPEYANGAQMAPNVYNQKTDTPKDHSFGDCSRRGVKQGRYCECEGDWCNDNQFLIGFNPDNTARCLPKQSEELCSSINLRTNGDCGEGSQMVRIEYGECETEYHPKGGGWEITCEDDKATCCSMIF